MKKQTKTQKKTQVKKQTVTKIVASDMKKCPKCGQSLPTKDFPHDYRRKDGLYIYCRACESKRQYEKHTRNVVKAAEENGYTVLKVIRPAPVLSIDVLKIDMNPNNGRTIVTELAPVQ